MQWILRKGPTASKLASSLSKLGISVSYEVIAYGGKPKDNKTKRAATPEDFFEQVIDSALRFSGIQT
jgi:hypothetical protein